MTRSDAEPKVATAVADRKTYNSFTDFYPDYLRTPEPHLLAAALFSVRHSPS